MKEFFKQILGLNNLYDRKVGLAFITDIIYVSIAVFSLLGVLGFYGINTKSYLGIFIFYFLIIFTGLYFIREIIQAIYITLIFKSRKYTIDINANEPTQIFSSAVNEELNYIDSVKVIKAEKGFKIKDLRFDFYRQTRSGEFKSKEAFYTTIEYKLKRNLPHIIFDSKRAKGSQFKSIFVGSQRLNLEGDFNQYFDIYSPLFYHIDTLSFITPEVMEAIIELKDYDIEIKNDSLICFAPILTNEQIEILNNKVNNLFYHLNNNLESYRDERLDFKIGKENITEFGRSLLISPKKYIIASLLFGTILSFFVYLSFYFNDPEIIFNYFTISILIILIYNLAKSWQTVSKNKELLASYKSNNKI